jgi:hypothetical protein
MRTCFFNVSSVSFLHICPDTASQNSPSPTTTKSPRSLLLAICFLYSRRPFAEALREREREREEGERLLDGVEMGKKQVFCCSQLIETERDVSASFDGGVRRKSAKITYFCFIGCLVHGVCALKSGDRRRRIRKGAQFI